MKSHRSLLSLAIVLMLTAAAGCAATPEDRWFQQREALNTANRIYLANVPLMTDGQVIYYGQLLQAARTHLHEANAQLPEGGSSFDTALDMTEVILQRVIALETNPAPGTAPTTPNSEDTPDDTR